MRAAVRASVAIAPATLALLAAGAGCFSPAPPSGAYSCESGGACPSGQHCTCGQCVAHDVEAACAFTVNAVLPACKDWPMATEGTAPPRCVREHEPFELAITALQADHKTVASGFQGGITVSSSWGDAVLAKQPAPKFANGVGRATVWLDRETIGPSGARITVRSGTATGTTAHVPVVAPGWQLDTAPALDRGQWASVIVTQPAVVRVGERDWRMYFAGIGGSGAGTLQAIGLARSSDGVAWTMSPSPVFTPTGGGGGRGAAVSSPAVFQSATGAWRLVVQSEDGAQPPDFVAATSPDGITAFTAPSTTLRRQMCSFCSGEKSAQFNGLNFPAVLPTGDAVHLYFSSVATNGQPVLGHASTLDAGQTWDVDPLPLFAGSVAGEHFIISPHVLVEGSVYKMFYVYSEQPPSMTGDPTLMPCTSLSLDIGYATSADGLYWIKSPSNPVLSTKTKKVPWAPAATSLIPGAALLADPADPSRGVQLFYSVFQQAELGGQKVCTPSGIGRAERQ